MNNWATSWENLFIPYAKNKGADSLSIRHVNFAQDPLCSYSMNNRKMKFIS